MILEIEKAAEERRAAEGKTVVGQHTVIAQDPDTQPTKTKRSPRPLVHAASKAMRKTYRTAYGAFVKAFRAASELLRGRNPLAEFPRWAFPPALVFVRTGEEILLFR